MKKNSIILCGVLLLVFLLSGCGGKREYFLYYGDYSSTLYAYKKDPSRENLVQHMEEMDSVINKSKELNIKVPPGIYAEYGYYLLKDGNVEQAKVYFEKESDMYPESAAFIQRLLTEDES